MTAHEAEIGLWMVMIGADREISEEELAALTDAATSRFGTALAIGELSVMAAQAQQRIDAIGAAAYVAELLPALPREGAVLETALAIAKSDSLADEERELIRTVSRALGLGDSF